MTQYLEFTQNHPVLVLAFLANLLFILYIEFSRRNAPYKNLSAQEATVVQNHQEGVFIDVREKSEFAQGHLFEAVSMPMSSLSKDLKMLEKYKGRPLIVYCATGNRSIRASRMLIKAEFSDVNNLHGGISAWQKANLPVTKR